MYKVLPIPSTSETLIEQLERPEFFAAKVGRLKSDSRRLREILATRILLKKMMGEEVEVLYDEDGCPRFDAPFADQFLSISHTDGYAAVIVEASRCAIDIERRGNRVQKVVSHFLTPEEVSIIDQCPDSLLALHLAWSAKETAYKVLGRDYYDLQHLTSIRQIDDDKQLITLHIERQEEPFRIHYEVHDDYVLTWLVR